MHDKQVPNHFAVLLSMKHYTCSLYSNLYSWGTYASHSTAYFQAMLFKGGGELNQQDDNCKREIGILHNLSCCQSFGMLQYKADTQCHFSLTGTYHC